MIIVRAIVYFVFMGRVIVPSKLRMVAIETITGEEFFFLMFESPKILRGRQ
jgi:hypothetical protein